VEGWTEKGSHYLQAADLWVHRGKDIPPSDIQDVLGKSLLLPS